MKYFLLPALLLPAFWPRPLLAEELLPLPGEEQARPADDPFFRSFTEAFDEVLAETAPELRRGEPDRNECADPAVSFLLSKEAAAEREMLERAIPAALACNRKPGAKARRGFIFARNEQGEYECLETGGDYDMTPGEFLFTGRPLDAAICEDGSAFFVLKKEGEEEPAYSRAGNFLADGEGFLYLERDQTRYYLQPRTADLERIGQLAVFPNPAFLASEEGVFFRETERSGKVRLIDTAATGITWIKRGYLENSNARPDLLLRRWKAVAESPLADFGDFK